MITEQMLDNLKFNNTLIKELPFDKIKDNIPRTVKGAIYSKVTPTPVKNPKVVSISTDALQLINLTKEDAIKKEFAQYFSGNKIMNGSIPISHCYCGHQFGQFAGQLGDGRAITLGEVVNNKGEKWELQLKGAGKTPYSRDGDGRAVLRSSIREFLCSEAFHFLGIPTTRAASIVTSETKVVRDPLYDGRAKEEPCTIVLRLAPSFIRFGSFEITKSNSNTGSKGPSAGMHYLLNNLLDYILKYHYSEIYEQFDIKEFNGKNRKIIYQSLFREIVKRTARLAAMWQCIGFCHGVLNTDNMSILGLTIDFGPFGFMDKYDPKFISNHSDSEGRYSFGNQPKICYSNLEKLARALDPVIPAILLDFELNHYWPTYYAYYSYIMHRKLGFVLNIESDAELFKSLFDTMYKTGSDFTNTFRHLHLVDPFKYEDKSLNALVGESDSIQNNIDALINRSNGNNDNRELWMAWLSKYRQRLSTEINSLKTRSKIDEWTKKRNIIMNTTNPKYVLRNWMAQAAIDAAEKNDYSEINKQLQVLRDPYGLQDKNPENIKYMQPPSKSSSKLRVSCSS